MNDTRKRIYQQIREYNNKLSDALDYIDKIPPENTEQIKEIPTSINNQLFAIIDRTTPMNTQTHDEI